MPPTRVAPEEDGQFGINMWPNRDVRNKNGQDCAPWKYPISLLRTSFQLGLFRTESRPAKYINVCFHIVISLISFLLYCILEQKDFYNLFVLDRWWLQNFILRHVYKNFFCVFELFRVRLASKFAETAKMCCSKLFDGPTLTIFQPLTFTNRMMCIRTFSMAVWLWWLYQVLHAR